MQVSNISNYHIALLYSPGNSTGVSDCQLYLAENTKCGLMYFTDKKCHIFNNIIYDEITRHGQINAKLMPELSVTAKVQNSIPNLNKKCQTSAKLSNRNFL